MERPDEDGHPRQRRTVHRGHRAPGLQEGRHRDRAQQRLPDRDREQPLRERRKGRRRQIHPPRTFHRPVLAQPLHRRAREAGGRESQI